VEAPGPGLDGVDVSGALLGKGEKGREKALFWKRPPDRPGPAGMPFPDLAVREGNWKLLIREDGGGEQLYDLAADPSETKNVAGEQAEVTARLKKALLEWNAGLPK
jgi:hypothetical protein